MSQSHPDDHLAYGLYNPQNPDQPGTGDSARGLVGDTFKKLRATYKSHHPPSQPQPPGQSQPYNQEGYYQVVHLDIIHHLISID